jgi:hypothetical protein
MNLDTKTLTLCAVIRDQEHYIKEWLAFHRLVGVERFILILHKCRDRTEEKINELPFRDDIIIRRITNDEQFVQLASYHWAVKTYGETTKWMMFIDSDEYLYGTTEDDLRTILSDYDEFSGVCAHWVNFGTNNHVLRPAGLSIESFTRRAVYGHYRNKTIKSIVKPCEVIGFISPHLMHTEKGIVREDFSLVPADAVSMVGKKALWSRLRCDHHHTRSMTDWVQRCERGSCNGPRDWKYYNVKRFREMDTNEVEDKCIQRFVPRLKTLLGIS